MHQEFDCCLRVTSHSVPTLCRKEVECATRPRARNHNIRDWVVVLCLEGTSKGKPPRGFSQRQTHLQVDTFPECGCPAVWAYQKNQAWCVFLAVPPKWVGCPFGFPEQSPKKERGAPKEDTEAHPSFAASPYGLSFATVANAKQARTKTYVSRVVGSRGLSPLL